MKQIGCATRENSIVLTYTEQWFENVDSAVEIFNKEIEECYLGYGGSNPLTCADYLNI